MDSNDVFFSTLYLIGIKQNSKSYYKILKMSIIVVVLGNLSFNKNAISYRTFANYLLYYLYTYNKYLNII